MTETNNPTSSAGSPAGPLRVGLIAEAAQAGALAEAIRACPAFELFAQAGMRQPEALPEVRWFDDMRVLIAQAGIQALVMAVPTRAGVELTKAAAAQNIHIWRTPPLGRNFAEALETAQRLKTGPAAYRVASWWDHVREPLLAALRLREGFKPQFSEIIVRVAGPPLQSWQASQIDAGGGVLPNDAYALLGSLIAVRGLPERVSGAVGKYRRRPGEAPRETEDAGTAILYYENGGVALLRASWDIPSFEQTVMHHGTDTTVILTRLTEPNADSAAAVGRVTVQALDGGVIDERALPGDFLLTEMRKFAEQIQAAAGAPVNAPSSGTTTAPPDGPSPAAALERHIAVAALLEAIYLSARTGQPETPQKFYEVQGWPKPGF